MEPTLSSNKILLPQICACGCGQEKKPDKDGRIRGRFIKGHCKAEKHPSWKGGVQIVNGYRLVYAPGHHMAQKDGYVLEHRKVMYEIIVRTLTRDEDVHHINGIKTDNRPQNLQLLSKSEHHKLHGHPAAGMKKDMSGRRCVSCGSDKTSIVIPGGRKKKPDWSPSAQWHITTPDGQWQCTKCYKHEWNIEHSAHVLEKLREWRSKHADRHRDYMREYYHRRRKARITTTIRPVRVVLRTLYDIVVTTA